MLSQKKNILAYHIAKYLSQKKQRKVIGSVHIMQQDGDPRKIALILSPPMEATQIEKNDDNDDTNDKKSKKRRKKNDGESAVVQSTKRSKKQRFRIRLIFGVKNNPSVNNPNGFWIPPARLFPNRNNNKLKSVCENNIINNNNPTPNYNNAIAADLHYINTTRIIQGSAKLTHSFQEAVTLAKIWCLQRGFLRGHDSFTTETIALLITYLYRTKAIGTRMGSLQVFTVFVKLLAETDWLGENQFRAIEETVEENNTTIRQSRSEGYQDYQSIYSLETKKKKVAIVLPEDGINEKQTCLNCIQNRLYASDYNDKGQRGEEEYPKSLVDCFKISTDSPIFLDPTMTYNYFGHLSPSFIRELQLEANRALKCLHRHSDGPSSAVYGGSPFRQLFLEHCRFWRRYDAFIRIDLSSIKFPTPDIDDSNKESPSQFWGNDRHDVGDYESISLGIIKLLRMALGNRITSIRTLSNGNGENFKIGNDSKEEGSRKNNASQSLVDSDERIAVPVISGTSFNGFRQGFVSSPVALNNEENSTIVIGLCLNPQTCHRLVDRGPPTDDVQAANSFVSLWGRERAQLRRFKDGAIVHAVVWNNVEHDLDEGFVQYSGDERNGSIVERIIRHIVRLHFCDKKCSQKKNVVQFALREMTSLIEAPAVSGSDQIDSVTSHTRIMTAFNALSNFLRTNSNVVSGTDQDTSPLGLPLAIDAVEGLSPCLRYSELFPHQPNPLLGDSSISKSKKVSGATMGTPILIQIRFEGSSKWPSDLNAIGAAKCAMLIQLATGIEKMKDNGNAECRRFGGPINVYPSYIDLGFLGYSWRIMIRADQELKVLSSLREPTSEATALCQVYDFVSPVSFSVQCRSYICMYKMSYSLLNYFLIFPLIYDVKALVKRHAMSATHHSLIHALHTQHPTAGGVVRLCQRWIGAHMLSGQIPLEAIELIVAYVFTNLKYLNPPSTIFSGFMRVLELLSTHDWMR